MDYRFYMRDEQGKSYAAATASVEESPDGNATAEWSGPEAAHLKAWLPQENFLMLGETFNPAKADHWRKLPEILSGHRLWVVV